VTHAPGAPLADDLASRFAARFAALPHTPFQHFTLYVYGAMLRVATHASSHFGSAEAIQEHLPFLAAYLDELLAPAGDDHLDDVAMVWRHELETWERRSDRRLPLAELRRAAACRATFPQGARERARADRVGTADHTRVARARRGNRAGGPAILHEQDWRSRRRARGGGRH
jgi:hypothetical protein